MMYEMRHDRSLPMWVIRHSEFSLQTSSPQNMLHLNILVFRPDFEQRWTKQRNVQYCHWLYTSGKPGKPCDAFGLNLVLILLNLVLIFIHKLAALWALSRFLSINVHLEKVFTQNCGALGLSLALILLHLVLILIHRLGVTQVCVTEYTPRESLQTDCGPCFCF